MRFYFVLLIILLSSSLFGQNQLISFSDNDQITTTEPYREVFDEGINGVAVSWTFPGASLSSSVEQNHIFQNLYIQGFSHTMQEGLPSLPSHIDYFIIPEGAQANLLVTKASTLTYNNFTVYPALSPASDEYGAPEPDFSIDSVFYNSNVVYPGSPVMVKELVKLKGISLMMVEVFPVQYNPATKKLMVHHELDYKIQFTHATQFINKQRLSTHFMKMLPNMVLNNQQLELEIDQYLATPQQIASQPDYLIITHQDYLAAADSLAKWKQQLGFHPEIIASSSWTWPQVKAAISARYQNYNPKPDYFVILGDNDKVPGKVMSTAGSTFATDLYYSTMDGVTDYVPDMAYGRISVSGAAQAMQVVQKIIHYERNPLIDSAFYQSALACAYFQDNGAGYAERRFAQTAEEIHDYLMAKGYNVERAYVTGANVNPLYWNNGLYSAGEALPVYLQKPNLAWNATATQINASINQGKFLVFHRDHGMTSGWGNPYYTTSDLNMLANNNKLPVVFSVNCLTGKYMDAECFAEKLLRLNSGGAVGVFAHGEVSYSGYNDGLALGLIDAIWASPGLAPNFTGTGGVANPNVIPHIPLYRMGDVKNQGLFRMVETWGGSSANIQYTYELLNYFGDPAMEIPTANPSSIVAIAGDSINCHNDTAYVVQANMDGRLTLTVEGELIAQGELQNGADTLFFSSITGSTALLTISGHNHIPYVKTVSITGGCPHAKFSVQADKYCLDDSVLVNDLSTGLIATRQWNFGAGAIPASDSGQGPFYVKYSTPGAKTITLTLTDTAGAIVTKTSSFTMDQYCRYTIPAQGQLNIDKCSGLLYDDGGIANYSDNTLGSVTISPPGASTISLNFSSFDFESGYDYLKIYDGPSVNANLIGVYTGNSLPNNGQINSTSGSITLQQQSDSYINHAGFVLSWQCNYSNSAPQADFSSLDTGSCNGMVHFTDHSLNGPTQWLWDFGDGVSSTLQHPEHLYGLSGTYTVKLVVSNAYGSDSLVKNAYIQVNRPAAPLLSGAQRCKSGTMNLMAVGSSPGTVYWYDSLSAGIALDTGNTFVTPVLDSSHTYYAELRQNQASSYVGKADFSGSGAYYTANYVHYLIFDCYKPLILHSVKVKALTAGNRLIQLRNSGGGLIQQKQVFIPAGVHRINLDFSIPVGTGLQLAAPAAPGLYRNSGNVNYPYRIANVLSIRESSASASTNYYYYFYDWEIIEGQCVSPRVPVLAQVSDSLHPVAAFAMTNNDPDVLFTHTGLYADSYYWEFGDGDFSLLENPSHTYKTNGTYQVILHTSNGCGSDQISKQLSITTAGLSTFDALKNFRLYPNPAENILYLNFNSLTPSKLHMKIMDVSGRVVLHRPLHIVRDNHVKVIVDDLASGLYTLVLENEHGRLIRQFVVR